MNDLPVREPLIFVDLETTGANFANDRIIEVGLVCVDTSGVSEWSSLVNPGTPVSPFITSLTGIDTAMVARAPRFEEIADEVFGKLRGRLFVAHNARFDYTFLKHEFHRLGVAFRAPNLCTVKLSRKLFPEHHRHSLDALLARYTLSAGKDRHRALGDARVLWQLWQRWHALRPAVTIDATVAAIVGRPELPPQFDATLIDDLPEAPGAYVLYDAAGEPLLVKRGTNLRQQLLGHFVPAKHDTPLVRKAVRFDWRETAGELGARLAEIELSAKRQRGEELCAWQLGAGEDVRPRLVAAAEIDFARASDLFGLYMNRREALQALTKLAEAHRLCMNHLGLAGKPGEICAAYRQKLCRGVCAGKEAVSVHGARLLAALAKFKINPWPYAGAAALIERDEYGTREDYHVFDAWRYLGRVQDEAALATLLENRDDQPGAFDAEIYRLVGKFLQSGKVRVLALPPRRSGAI